MQGFRSKMDEGDQQFNDINAYHLFEFLYIDTKISSLNKKSKRQASKSDTQKRNSLPHEIYNYIYPAHY